MSRIFEKTLVNLGNERDRHELLECMADRDAWQHAAEIKAEYADKLKKELEDKQKYILGLERTIEELQDRD